jgi:hypothetical protein
LLALGSCRAAAAEPVAAQLKGQHCISCLLFYRLMETLPSLFVRDTRRVCVSSLDESRAGPETSLPKVPANDVAGGDTETSVNEIVQTAKEAKEREERADKRSAWIAAGVGVGIGSAALVAAMLYANRDKPKDKKK